MPRGRWGSTLYTRTKEEDCAGDKGGGFEQKMLAELSHSKFDPKSFSHSTYVNFFVIFTTKVPYLSFCDKMSL